jgi:hypothetical protein
LLKHAYGKHPFAHEILEICSFIEEIDVSTLSELNINLLKWILQKMNISSKIILSSETNILGRRTERIINLLYAFNADKYISPKGSFGYLDDDKFIEKTNINLVRQDFNAKPYKQYKNNDFEPNLSIVDIVANIGWKLTKEYIY